MIKLIKTTFYKEMETKRNLSKFITSAKQLSFGVECKKFEERFAKYQNRKHCIFFNSGSSANLGLIQALLNLGQIQKGDHSAFSALTWATNLMPLIELGLNVVPVDVELDTLNVSSRKFTDILEKYPLKLFFLTNLLGFCDDIDEIVKICKKRKIILIEDNCEGLGSVYKGKKLGNFGLASTFSFYVGHHLSTIEGGAVCTDSDQLAIMLRLVRAHGWDRNIGLDEQSVIRKNYRVDSSFYAMYTFYDLGYNLRPTEITAFLGNTQLKYLDEIIEKRKRNFQMIADEVYKLTDLYYPLRFAQLDIISNFAFPVICRSKSGLEKLIKNCQGKIEIRPIVGGDMTVQPFFNKYLPHFQNISSTPNAKLIHNQGLYVGNNPDLTKKEIKTIIDVFTNQ
ncbi:hypothetical protein A3C32_04240 [Candidatus Daviesbacteria bacterium RIFCSPHIGHO2_02_FULL_41_14]|uniref:DegT/DnrJ/EryC1/StrS aminotransferase n=1 Tax=Candidatus Daviesbacteria bacterium RIFCSPLOWO2_01_FULL_40_24 TaxID=1797787 RepID=A0A1F5MJ78_9BACT|nr:MAG: hypothetical protein A3C32_04240 [Candidatus Daviesbacteria bacterium RIFCSPHIGHO2_02_FULL_41_14]OGE65436.1 MAG: hypothetical protein A3B49_00935 [Candidatus Daviesbacteria bacterium RIFCSPLOWO2_01_FULL_40_24]